MLTLFEKGFSAAPYADYLRPLTGAGFSKKASTLHFSAISSLIDKCCIAYHPIKPATYVPN